MIEGKNKTVEHGRNLVSYLIFMEVWVRTLYIIRKKYCKGWDREWRGEQKAARLKKVAEPFRRRRHNSGWNVEGF